MTITCIDPKYPSFSNPSEDCTKSTNRAQNPQTVGWTPVISKFVFCSLQAEEVRGWTELTLARGYVYFSLRSNYISIVQIGTTFIVHWSKTLHSLVKYLCQLKLWLNSNWITITCLSNRWKHRWRKFNLSLPTPEFGLQMTPTFFLDLKNENYWSIPAVESPNPYPNWPWGLYSNYAQVYLCRCTSFPSLII